MRVDIDKLADKKACESGMKWLKSLGTLDMKSVIESGIKEGRLSDLRWGMSRLMTKEQCVEWAIYCAEQVIGIFEKKYPEDSRPRRAIEAAKEYLKNPCDETKRAADAAADAAYAAADAAYAAAYAAYAAYAAADAAAYAAAAADADAYAAAAADADADADIKEKCIWKGYEILTGEKYV
jgi:hypothetical protein